MQGLPVVNEPPPSISSARKESSGIVEGARRKIGSTDFEGRALLDYCSDGTGEDERRGGSRTGEWRWEGKGAGVEGSMYCTIIHCDSVHLSPTKQTRQPARNPNIA